MMPIGHRIRKKIQMYLDRRQRATVMAALELWLSLARNSESHPAEFHKARKWFYHFQEPPMDDEDVQALIELMETGGE